MNLKVLRIAFYATVVVVMAIAIFYNLYYKGNESGGTSLGLIITYCLLGLAVLGALAAVFMGAIHDPKSGIKGVIMIALIALCFGIGYMISDGVVLEKWTNHGISTASDSKMIDGGLIMFYIIGGAGIIGILFSEFSSFFKR